MATLLYTIIGMTASASLNCAVRREISPCTCSPHGFFANTIEVKCEQMESFHQVVDALQDRFTPDYNIWLTISHSQLLDLATQSFYEMNMNIKSLKMNFDNLSHLPVSTFQNLPRLEYFSAAENRLEEIPADMFLHMPNVGTLDFAKGNLRFINGNTFKQLQNLRHLVVASNILQRIDVESMPRTLISLHYGHNNLTTLNGTLRHLDELKLLFINDNHLTSLDDELPLASPNLMTVFAQNNRIDHLPIEIKYLKNLDSLFIHGNQLKSFDGLLARSAHLTKLIAFDNKINQLRKDEFTETERLEEVQLAGNKLNSLNGSLLNMKGLIMANFSNNLLNEFSLQEVTGLRKLRILDLSYNKIERLTGRMENLVDSGSIIYELRLQHNLLKSLDGTMMGLNNLKILNVAHNRLEMITPDDLIGMENLEHLDLSFNKLKTLEELSKTFLPSLQSVNASYNLLTTMDKDFHGLPVLCTADLSNNMIRVLTVELVSQTRCSNHGVPNKLEIFLQENPVLCDESLPELVSQMESYHTRLIGIAHCIVPQQIPIDSPIFMQPPIPLLKPLLKPQLPMVPSPVMIQQPSIVQILVPAPLVVQAPAFAEAAAGMMQTIPSVQGIQDLQQQAIISPPQIAHLPQQQQYDELKYDAHPETVAESETMAPPPEENDIAKILAPTSTTMKTILEFKNVIHDTYSAISPKVLPIPYDKAQGIATEPEEPPETQQDQGLDVVEH
ncbi:insulin-like growth factor-binding protein complex acid labile subunit isoform X1 [Toxorhynchites rutilus septentrionalis]|uniref:insulin-like growth factor-binding protein complex acid labile subunit isoform X1 n=2 Tax=Toxorhynchites rutilus septentrionalis TaxID=329112 RepID=UPI002478D71C|nr:insulin-like growth factor-binding protein complex acid labile subunit isoform X1 [Toxorhynchites rutilus septentrionalis]